MGERSAIEWTDSTWNPTSGCHKVSPGCKHCYAERVFPRAYAKSGRKFTDVALHPERLTQPMRWTRPRRIFVDSMSDLFHEAVPFAYVDKVFAVMALTPRHTHQVLTKRADRMLAYLTDETLSSEGGTLCAGTPERIAKAMFDIDPNAPDVAWPLPNAWLGVSVEDQERAEERIPLLLDAPAKIRFLSCEPLLGPVDLMDIAEANSTEVECCANPSCNACDGTGKAQAIGLHWVIAGGESGPRARPMEVAWCEQLAQDCDEAGIAFFMKQGSAANWPDFKNFESFPEHLKVREFPR